MANTNLTIGNDTKKIGKFDLFLSQQTREYQGIPEWRNAIEAAENIYAPCRLELYNLYNEIILDTHLGSVIEQRKDKVINTRIRFMNNDGTENKDINKLIDTQGAENMINDILDSKFWGHSLLWFNSITADKIDYKLIPRKHVDPINKVVLTRATDKIGIVYNTKKMQKYTLEIGKDKDLGILVRCAPWVIYKKGGMSDFALFVETFGSPFREYIYTDQTSKLALEKAAKLIGASQFIVRPETGKFNLHDTANKTGARDIFIGLMKMADQQLSKAILHNTMTTDAQGGNYKGEVHQQSEAEVTKADKKFVTRVLNENFIALLNEHGIKAEGYFFFEEADTIEPEKRFNMDMKFAEKFEVEPTYFYEKYKIPIPKSGAAYKTQTTGSTKEEGKEIAGKKDNKLSQQTLAVNTPTPGPDPRPTPYTKQNENDDKKGAANLSFIRRLINLFSFNHFAG